MWWWCALLVVVRSQTYSDPTARRLSTYAGLAYMPQARTTSTWGRFASARCNAEVAGTSLVGAWAKNHAAALLVDDPARNEAIVAFKGSNNTADLISALSGGELVWRDCVVRNVSLGRVHAAFCTYARDILGDALVGGVARLVGDGRDLVLTGHSYGAAGAVAAAAFFFGSAEVDLAPSTVYTYGQPRVGDVTHVEKLYAATARGGAFRVVNRNDPVAHLPVCCGITACNAVAHCPFHNDVQAWYATSMHAAADATVCPGPDGHDACGDAVDTNVTAHMWYFERDLGYMCMFPDDAEPPPPPPPRHPRARAALRVAAALSKAAAAE